MATYFPLKGENHQNSISLINYQPSVPAEHLLAREEVHKVIARNHGFDYRDQDARVTPGVRPMTSHMGRLAGTITTQRRS